MTSDSKSKEILSYSFLVAFANDRIIDQGELEFMEKLALEDRQVDEQERAALQAIFERAASAELSQEVQTEIARFRQKYGI
jgi:hypothetical protein